MRLSTARRLRQLERYHPKTCITNSLLGEVSRVLRDMVVPLQIQHQGVLHFPFGQVSYQQMVNFRDYVATWCAVNICARLFHLGRRQWGTKCPTSLHSLSCTLNILGKAIFTVSKTVWTPMRVMIFSGHVFLSGLSAFMGLGAHGLTKTSKRVDAFWAVHFGEPQTDLTPVQVKASHSRRVAVSGTSAPTTGLLGPEGF